jgi:hypothetical protein
MLRMASPEFSFMGMSGGTNSSSGDKNSRKRVALME